MCRSRYSPPSKADPLDESHMNAGTNIVWPTEFYRHSAHERETASFPLLPHLALSAWGNNPWHISAQISPQYPGLPHDQSEIHQAFITLALLACKGGPSIRTSHGIGDNALGHPMGEVRVRHAITSDHLGTSLMYRSSRWLHWSPALYITWPPFRQTSCQH